MTASVVMIGLDAFEAPLAEEWARQGVLPNLRRLIDRGTSAALANSMDTLPFGIWPEIATGRLAARSGVLFHARQLRTGEAVPRATRVDERDAGAQLWSVASQGGARVCVIDVPQSVVVPDMNGVQVYEWGLHDRHVELRSEPPSVLEGIRARWGDHPVVDCDTHHDQTPEGYLRLLADLEWGAKAKAEWATELLEREHWDLFMCCFSESHCIGHQLRHLADPRSDDVDQGVDQRLRDSWRTIYERTDEAIGRLLDAAGPEATVLVVASHGMEEYIGGYQLIPPLLRRMALGPHLARVTSARRVLPRSVRRALYRMVPRRVSRPILRQVGVHHELRWLEDPSNRAAAVVVGRVGAIRLNLEGREPFGTVSPGREADELIEDLRRSLLELRLPGTDTPVVKDVFTGRERFGASHHPDVPDLVVVFRRDLGPIQAAESERLGLLQSSGHDQGHARTGDHSDASRLWAAGPEIPPGTWLPPGDVLDIAPTLLRLLDVPVPPRCDGRALDLTAGSTSPPAEWLISGGRRGQVAS